ncbi:hypothetical protein [Devosia sp. Root635]|uniref:hypothetical protein n=1 Tax=Devosia sp. Root635 TaxID=1736575 RepID=UPI0006FAB24E|nr:hypothetical protein [Devosia sp. Root635]KRA45637.1 DNA-binding protein [Devosia sp. Root635]
MDSTINAAAQALASGDVLGALNRVALRNDPPALALHGIAMAQLGDFARAKTLLKTAARRFGRREPVAQARCVVAEAEIALVSRDLAWPPERLEESASILALRGDTRNAAHARCIAARRSLLLGQLDLAQAGLARLDPARLSPMLRASYFLVSAGIHIRRAHAVAARQALAQAHAAALHSAIPALIAEVEAAQVSLSSPVAVLHRGERAEPIGLDGVERLLASDTLVIDTTRNVLRRRDDVIALSSRPILFALLRTLAETWPSDATRETLLRRAFNARQVDESHRGRLRVEIARLRQAIAPLATVSATPNGFRLAVHNAENLAMLASPLDGQNAAVMALLADGESWSSSALALALDVGIRTVQRALTQLQEQQQVQSIGHGRTRRWTMLTAPGFPRTLLLPQAR